MSKIISVVSGKGGVGKSTISGTVAVILSDMGYRVLVIDADADMRNLDLILGVRDNIVWDISDLRQNKCSFEDVCININDHENLFFIPAPAFPENEKEELGSFIRNLAENRKNDFDFIILDCPSGVGRIFKSVTGRGQYSVVVATPDVTSLRDAEKTAELLRDTGVHDIRLVINRIRPSLIKKGSAPNVDEMIDSISVQLLGLVPEDGNVCKCANAGTLLSDVHKSKARIAISNIANRISGNDVPLFEFWK